jgi:hypothetical protein
LTKSHRLRVLAAFGPALLAAGAVAASASSAFANTATTQPEGEALFTTQGSVAPQFLAGATTIPHWTFQYTDPTNGVTYPITMVGTDPRVGGSTTIHTVLIPLKMNFVAAGQDPSSLVGQGYAAFQPQFVNHTFDGTSKLSQTEASPIFASRSYDADLGGDTGQLGDTFMRAQFNKIGSDYHVNLDYTVAPTQTLDVPATKGIAYERPVSQWRRTHGLQTDADYTGLAEINWFSTQLQSLMGSLQISATTVPIFLTDNVLLYFKGTVLGYQNCCVLGYHGAAMPVGHGTGSINGQGKQPVQTFMYTAYVTPGTYSGFLADYTNPNRVAPRPTRGLSDIHALSHELAEWLDDPYTNNAVQPWKVASAPQYGCTRVLEVGDPVVGVWFGMSGNTQTNAYGQWHPEDEVFAQWFGRGGVEPVLGSSWDGRFTYMGPRTTALPGYSSFSIYATNC